MESVKPGPVYLGPFPRTRCHRLEFIRYVTPLIMSRAFREISEALILALIVFLLIQGSVRNFKVDGSSMLPSLESGQFLLVNKLVYFRLDTSRLSRVIPFWDEDTPSNHFVIHPPRRGEVIVFRFPNDPSKDFVKRVIGLPGEEVEVVLGTPYIDGVGLQEPYLRTQDRSRMSPLLLGDGEYFVMGDNRRSSNDSRNWGAVPEENILGKVWVVYWPFTQAQILETAPSFTWGLFPG